MLPPEDYLQQLAVGFPRLHALCEVGDRFIDFPASQAGALSAGLLENTTVGRQDLGQSLSREQSCAQKPPALQADR